MAMVMKDDWVRAAMTDDRMVVDLLLRLKQSSSPPSTSYLAKTSLPPPRWGVRQPRSRMAIRCDAVSPEKKRDSARNSPTTPLTWSGGSVGGAASSSGTADGSDESTLPASRSSDSRSKVVDANDPRTADVKKSKRKKTYTELKEEEVSLLKERVHLKKEIASLRTTFKEHTATNENLKRLKLDFDLNSSKGATTATDETEETVSALEKMPVLIRQTSPSSQLHLESKNACQPAPSSSCQVSIPVEDQDGGFLLPDLNMMPSEDDLSSEVLHGVSYGETIQVTAS